VRKGVDQDHPTTERLSVQAAILSIGKVLVRLSGLISAAVLSRYLSLGDYGTYRQVFLIYNTALRFLVLGIPLSMNYFIPKLITKERQKGLIVQSFILLTLSGGGLSIAMFLLAPTLARSFANPNLISVIKVFALVPIVAFPTRFYQQMFTSLGLARLAAGMSASLAFLRVASVIIPVVMGFPLDTVFYSIVAFYIVQAAVVVGASFSRFRGVSICRQPGLLVDQMRYSLPLALNAAVAILAYQMDKIMVSAFFSPESYAIYANGAIEVPFVGIITGSVTAVLTPALVRYLGENDPTKAVQVWRTSIIRVSKLIFPIMALLLVVAPEFIRLLFSEKYLASTLYFRIYLLSLLVRVTTFSAVLLALGQSSVLVRYSFYMLVVNGILNFIFLQWLGLAGPALATVIALYALGILQLRRISRSFSLRASEIFPWKPLLRAFLVAIGAGIVAAVPSLLLRDASMYARLPVVGFAFCVSYFLLRVALNDNVAEDMRLLLRMLRGLRGKR